MRLLALPLAFRGEGGQVEVSESRGDFAWTKIHVWDSVRSWRISHTSGGCRLVLDANPLRFNAWDGFWMPRPEFKAISNIVKAYGEKLKKHKASVVEVWRCFFLFGWGRGMEFSSFRWGFVGWRLVDNVLSYVSYLTDIRIKHIKNQASQVLTDAAKDVHI